MAIQQKLSLMIPGPTPVPEKVLQALSKHPIGHRSKEFQDLVESTTKNLQWLHQTQNDVLTITGSGTAAMEAGIINTLSKGDKVICGENGKFGDLFIRFKYRSQSARYRHRSQNTRCNIKIYN